jgi:Icc-related predicted phosphoesterase
VVSAGQIQMGYVGSHAARAIIEPHKPAPCLHGYIHESKGVARLGKALCIKAGGAYADAILHGATSDSRQEEGRANTIC